MKLTSLAQSPIQHVLIYGPPKTGKTQLLNELTKEFNLIYVGLENGHAPFYKLPLEQQERVEIINIPDTRDNPMAAETCLKISKGTKHIICDMHGKVECPACKTENLKTETDPKRTFTEVEFNALTKQTIVVFDSLTQFTNSIIAHITRGKPEDYKLEQDDWGNLGKLMDIFLTRIQQAGYHVIAISHESEAEMEDGKKKIVPVAGTRNFSRNAAKYFDHVIYSQVSNMKHVFKSSTTSTNNIVTGSRTDFDLETAGSLLPLFNGKIASIAQSPAQKAAVDLKSMVLKKA